MMDQAEIIVEPTKFDVLCGKGRICWQHEGNRLFHSIIKSFVPLYIKSQKREKSLIVREIIDKVTVSYKGRFLKKCLQGPKGWYNAGKRAAREKIGHALRDAVAEIAAGGKEKAKAESKKRKAATTRKRRARKIREVTAWEDRPTASTTTSSSVFLKQFQPMPTKLSANNASVVLPSFNSPLEVLEIWEAAIKNSEEHNPIPLDDILKTGPSISTVHKESFMTTTPQQTGSTVPPPVLEEARSFATFVSQSDIEGDFDAETRGGLLGSLDDDTLSSSLSDNVLECLSDDYDGDDDDGGGDDDCCVKPTHQLMEDPTLLEFEIPPAFKGGISREYSSVFCL